MAVGTLVGVTDQYSPDSIVSLIKFGRELHMNALLKTGQLFMQTIGHFRKLEDGEVRGDRDEGLNYLMTQPKMGVITIGGHTLNPDDIVRVTVSRDYDHGIHVFSMTGVSWETTMKMVSGGNAVHPQVTTEFGDTALVILNAKEFLRRVDAACRKNVREANRGWAIYFDPSSHSGPVTLHHKNKNYDWQTEYRITVPPTGEPSFILDIGSLEDIAAVTPASEVNSMFSATEG